MKRYIFIILALLTCVATSYADQNEPDGKKNIHFTYDVDFEMNFDNREYYKSAFSESMTIFGARLTPSVGLEAVQSDGTSHRVMIGADIMKDFGAPPPSQKLHCWTRSLSTILSTRNSTRHR